MLEKVLDEFKNLAAIPRPSKHEKRVSDFLRDYLKSYGFEVIQDGVNNIIAEIPATVGKENAPRTILQAHMDMVCVAEDNCKFNPLEDAIKLVRTEDFLTAEGTSLGADDGMGIAEILYIAKNHKNFSHGAIRIIFTVDEEQGMTGAINLNEKYLADAKYFINCDSENYAEIVAGSAGNVHVNFSRRIEYTAPKFSNAFKIKFSGMRGGHSGLEIAIPHLNAIKVAIKFLKAIKDAVGVQLATITGGTAPNVIPSESEMVIVTDLTAQDISVAAFLFQRNYKKIEPNLKIEFSHVDIPEKVFNDETSQTVSTLLGAFIHGVYSVKNDPPEMSVNLGMVRTAETVEVNLLFRANSTKTIEIFVEIYSKFSELEGVEVSFSEITPAWDFNPDSRLVKIMADIFERQNNFAPKVHAIHAGLECSFFAVKNPALDIVSIGTTNEFIHSPKERLHLKTVEPQVKLILETLKQIAK